MITYTEAKRIAEDEINRGVSTPGDRLVLLDEYTIQKDYGWVFFYQSQRFVETQDRNYLLIGNGPFIVETDGRVHHLGSANPAEESIAAFESSRRASKP
jgi:hypothetical protein